MAKLKSINPANGKELGSVKINTKAEIEAVVAKARQGLKEWRKISLDKRAKLMIQAARLVRKEAKRLGRLITEEMGKPLKDGLEEPVYTAEEMEWLAKKAAEILRDEVVSPVLPKTKLKQMKKLKVEDKLDYLTKKGVKSCSVIRYDARGVVAMIKPWNYPIESIAVSLVPALMAGNVVVLKPSEETPLAAQELVKLFWQAGVPRDVLQIVHGRGQTGAMLVEAEIDMVSFTGSSAVGKEIAEKCSRRLVKCVLEMGGSSAAVVAKDADLDLAVNGVLNGRFQNCGQVCAAIKRVFVEKTVAQKFIDQLAKQVEKLRVGSPMDKATQVGPLVSQKQLKKLQAQVTRGVVQGGRIIVGGRRMREEKYMEGFYHEPTLMIHVTPRMEIMQEEVFGPVLPVNVVESFELGLKYANQSRYGLTAVVFTRSKKRAMRAMEKLEAGAVCVNETNPWDVRACFGGVKESGMGRELGKHGIWEFSEIKTMKINLTGEKTKQGWF